MRNRSVSGVRDEKTDGPQGLAVLGGNHEHQELGIFDPTMNRDGFAASGQFRLSHRRSRLVPS
jgi:hypothetical protein